MKPSLAPNRAKNGSSAAPAHRAGAAVRIGCDTASMKDQGVYFRARGSTKTRRRRTKSGRVSYTAVAYVYSEEHGVKIYGTGEGPKEAKERASAKALLYDAARRQGLEHATALSWVRDKIRRGYSPASREPTDVSCDEYDGNDSFDRFLQFFIAKAMDMSSYEGARRNRRFARMLSAHQLPGGQKLGSLPISRLRPHHMREAILSLQRRRTEAENKLGDNYLADFKLFVAKVCDWLYAWALTERNFRAVLPRVERPQRRSLKARTSDALLLFRAARDPRLECFLVLAYQGACVQEILGLHVGMVEGNRIRLEWQFSRMENPAFDSTQRPSNKNPKTIAALLPWLKRLSRKRTIVLTDELMKFVMRSIDLARPTEVHCPDGVGSFTPVVPNQSGGFWRSNAFRREWDQMCNRAGVRITPHQFRALLTNEERARGVDLDVIAAWLGHSGPATTVRSYLRYEENDVPMLEPMLERAKRFEEGIRNMANE